MICFRFIASIRGKIVLRLQKLRWTNIFTIEMLIFAIFVQKNDFEQSQFQKVDVALSQFL